MAPILFTSSHPMRNVRKIASKQGVTTLIFNTIYALAQFTFELYGTVYALEIELHTHYSMNLDHT